LERSFEFMSNLQVTVTPGPIELTGDRGEARATLLYEFVNARSRERQQNEVPIIARLVRETTGWTITGIR
jgi:hypothetical protein